MNKAELIDAMASASGLSKADAKRALDGFITSVQKSLKGGKKVSLVGFGSFTVAKRAARKGKNPRTGETINIPAKKAVRFKAGSDLSTIVNK
jgi:DNA-binding protein HU-beta